MVAPPPRPGERAWDNEPPPAPTVWRRVRDVVTVLLLLLWLLWPGLAFDAFIASFASFGGEATPAERDRITMFLASALVSALGAPVAAFVAAGRDRWGLRKVALVEIGLVPVMCLLFVLYY